MDAGIIQTLNMKENGIIAPNHEGTDRQYECQLSITAQMVIDEIKKASV